MIKVTERRDLRESSTASRDDPNGQSPGQFVIKKGRGVMADQADSMVQSIIDRNRKEAKKAEEKQDGP